MYADEVSESARHWTWQKNRELVKTHNSNSTKHGYTLALNQFADLVSNKIALLRGRWPWGYGSVLLLLPCYLRPYVKIYIL